MPTFDVVSELEMHEVDNAVHQAQKEVAQRFDFRGTDTSVERKEEEITLRSNSESRIEAAMTVLQEKLVRRSVSLKSLDAQAIAPASGGKYKQVIQLRQGVPQDKARQIVKLIKDTKLKAQASIQGEQVRVSGKKRDDLQEVIALLREREFDLPLQFINFRD